MQDSTKYEILIAPHPSLQPGVFKSKATLFVNTPEGERLSGATFGIDGRVQAEVRPLPARLMLGSKEIGEKAEAVVVLQASAATKVIVERIETDSPDIHVEPATIEGSPPERTFRVSQRVTQLGDQVGTVHFFIRKGSRPAEPIVMEVTYRGEVDRHSSEQKGKEQ
jgi:hypothetical protein